MSEITNLNLSGVTETLLMAVYIRAMESQPPHALIKDSKSVELAIRMSRDFSRVRQIPQSKANMLVVMPRNW